MCPSLNSLRKNGLVIFDRVHARSSNSFSFCSFAHSPIQWLEHSMHVSETKWRDGNIQVELWKIKRNTCYLLTKQWHSQMHILIQHIEQFANGFSAAISQRIVINNTTTPRLRDLRRSTGSFKHNRISFFWILLRARCALSHTSLPMQFVCVCFGFSKTIKSGFFPLQQLFSIVFFLA